MELWIKFIQDHPHIDRINKKKSRKLFENVNLDISTKTIKSGLRTLRNELEVNKKMGTKSVTNKEKDSIQWGQIINETMTEVKKEKKEDVPVQIQIETTSPNKRDKRGTSTTVVVDKTVKVNGKTTTKVSEDAYMWKDPTTGELKIPCKIVRLHHKPNIDEYMKYHASLLSSTSNDIPATISNPFYLLMNIYPRSLIPSVYNRYEELIGTSELDSVYLPTVSVLITRHYNNDACFYFPHKKLWNISNQKNIIRKTLDINAVMHLIDRAMMMFAFMLNNLSCPKGYEDGVSPVSFPRISSCFRNLDSTDKEFVKGAMLVIDVFTIMCPEAKGQLSQYFSSDLYEEYKRDKWETSFDRMSQGNVKKTIVMRMHSVLGRLSQMVNVGMFSFGSTSGKYKEPSRYTVNEKAPQLMLRKSPLGIRQGLATVLYVNLLNAERRLSWFEVGVSMKTEGKVSVIPVDTADNYLDSSYDISIIDDQSIEVQPPREVRYECGISAVSPKGIGRGRHPRRKPIVINADDIERKRIEIQRSLQTTTNQAPAPLTNLRTLNESNSVERDQTKHVTFIEPQPSKRKPKLGMKYNTLDTPEMKDKQGDETNKAGNLQVVETKVKTMKRKKQDTEVVQNNDGEKKEAATDGQNNSTNIEPVLKERKEDVGTKITLSRIIEHPNDTSPINCRPNCSLYRYRTDGYEPPDLTSFNVNLSLSEQTSSLFDSYSVDSYLNCGVQLSLSLRFINYEEAVGEDLTRQVEETHELFDDSYVKFGTSSNGIINNAYKSKSLGSESGRGLPGSQYLGQVEIEETDHLAEAETVTESVSQPEVTRHHKKDRRRGRESDDKGAAKAGVYGDEDYPIFKHIEVTHKEVSARLATSEDDAVHIDVQIQQFERLQTILGSWCKKFKVGCDEAILCATKRSSLSHECQVYFGRPNGKDGDEEDEEDEDEDEDNIEGPPPPKMGVVYADIIKSLYEDEECEPNEEDSDSGFNILDYINETPLATVPVVLNRVKKVLKRMYRTQAIVHNAIKVDLDEYHQPCLVTEHIAKYYSRRDTKAETMEARLTRRRMPNRNPMSEASSPNPYPFPLTVNRPDDLVFLDVVQPGQCQDIKLDLEVPLTLMDFSRYSLLFHKSSTHECVKTFSSLFQDFNVKVRDIADVNCVEPPKERERRQNVIWKPKAAFSLLVLETLRSRLERYKSISRKEYMSLVSTVFSGVFNGIGSAVDQGGESIARSIVNEGIAGLEKRYSRAENTITLANNDISVFLIYFSVLTRRIELIYSYLVSFGGIDRGVYNYVPPVPLRILRSSGVCPHTQGSPKMSDELREKEMALVKQHASKFKVDKSSFSDCVTLNNVEKVQKPDENTPLTRREAVNILYKILHGSEPELVEVGRCVLGEQRHMLMNVNMILNILFTLLLKFRGALHGAGYSYKQSVLLSILLRLSKSQSTSKAKIPYIPEEFMEYVSKYISHKDAIYVVESSGPVLFLSAIQHRQQTIVR